MPVPASPDGFDRTTRWRNLELDGLFRPRTVAVVGSNHEGHLRPDIETARIDLLRTIRAWSERVGAVCSSADATDTGRVDLAVVLTDDAPDVLDEVLSAGPAFAVITGGRRTGAEPARRQIDRRTRRLLSKSRTRVLGPGVDLSAFDHAPERTSSRDIGLITQGRHLGRALVRPQELGGAVSQWVDTGAAVDVEFADVVKWMSEQPDVGVIAAAVGEFVLGDTLTLAADHAAKLGIPIACVTTPRSDPMENRVVADFFGQYGITAVHRLDELGEIATALLRCSPPRKPRRRHVAVHSLSGIAGGHLADLVRSAGMEVVPPITHDDGPGGPDTGAVHDAVSNPAVDLVMCVATSATDLEWNALGKELIRITESAGTPVFLASVGPNEDSDLRQMLSGHDNLVSFRTLHNCVAAAGSHFERHEFATGYRSQVSASTTRPARGAGAVKDLVRAGATLGEIDSKAVLTAYGIPVTRDVLTTSADRAAKAARKFPGPVVMKVASTEITYKSDLGLVLLDVHGGNDVRAAFDKIVRRADKRAKGARIDGVLVCETAPAGIECLIRSHHDPLFGPVVTFGLAGVTTELFDDIAVRVPPFGRREARRMVDQIVGSVLLKGYRGLEPVAIGAVVDTLVAVQRLAIDHADDIDVIELHPLLATTDGAVTLDASVVCR